MTEDPGVTDGISERGRGDPRHHHPHPRGSGHAHLRVHRSQRDRAHLAGLRTRWKLHTQIARTQVILDWNPSTSSPPALEEPKGSEATEATEATDITWRREAILNATDVYHFAFEHLFKSFQLTRPWQARHLLPSWKARWIPGGLVAMLRLEPVAASGMPRGDGGALWAIAHKSFAETAQRAPGREGFLVYIAFLRRRAHLVDQHQGQFNWLLVMR